MRSKSPQLKLAAVALIIVVAAWFASSLYQVEPPQTNAPQSIAKPRPRSMSTRAETSQKKRLNPHDLRLPFAVKGSIKQDQHYLSDLMSAFDSVHYSRKSSTIKRHDIEIATIGDFLFSLKSIPHKYPTHDRSDEFYDKVRSEGLFEIIGPAQFVDVHNKNHLRFLNELIQRMGGYYIDPITKYQSEHYFINVRSIQDYVDYNGKVHLKKGTISLALLSIRCSGTTGIKDYEGKFIYPPGASWIRTYGIRIINKKDINSGHFFSDPFIDSAHMYAEEPTPEGVEKYGLRHLKK